MDSDSTSSATDDLITRNARYAESHPDADLPALPALRLAVVTCMDCRMHVSALLGVAPGEGHIIRNAGGVITDDVIRSLCLSQRRLGTHEIVLIHHTDCGLATLTEEEFFGELEAATGERPGWALQEFVDPYDDVRESARRLRANPFLLHRDQIRGFVYDVADGLLNEVDLNH